MDQSQGGNPFGRLIEFARPHKTGYIVSVVLAVLGVAFGSIADYHSCWNDVLHGNDEGISQEVWGSCKSWKSHERNNGRIHRWH